MKRTIFEPEHDQFRDSVRAFLTKEAVPHTEKWEAQGSSTANSGRWPPPRVRRLLRAGEIRGSRAARLPVQRDPR